MTSKELGELYTEYSKFCPTIKPIDMNDVDIDYILVSNKCPIGENVFRLLCESFWWQQNYPLHQFT